jgi:ketosteroid isomerase-like protein
MKKKLIGITLLSCLMTLVITCSPKEEESEAAPVVDKEQIKQEIQAKENQFAEVYNSGELKNIGYYADDAISFSQNKTPIVGKTAIIEYITAGIDSSFMGNKITFTTNEVFVSSDGNQVVEIGYYNLVDSTNFSVNTGNYMVLFEKRNGSYVAVRDMSASDIPLE